MKLLVGASIALVFAAVPVLAEQRYDRKLEQAAIKIVAGKMGDIRGGFSYEQKPRFVAVQDANPGSDVAPSRQEASPSIVAPSASPPLSAVR